MPCQSYESNKDSWYEQEKKERALRDKLARIACRAMTLLEEKGITLHNKEANQWFQQHKIDDARAQKEKVDQENAARVKEYIRKNALSKLTLAERKELGIK